MKKIITLIFVVFLLMSATKAQYWTESSDDTIYYKNPVLIGTDEGGKAMLYIASSPTSTGGNGLFNSHTVDNTYLKFTSVNKVGYSSIYDTQAQGASFHGTTSLETDNAASMDSHSGGGYFVLEFDDYYPYDNSSYIHYLGGSYNTIRGDVSEYPESSVIAAVIGNDQIMSDYTYGGYFNGRGYFSDNVGIGTTEPSAKLEVADGDIYISDIEKGIIMKSPDGNCWRGTLDNDGNLTFSAIDCPDESDVEGVSTQTVQELSSTSEDTQLVIYPNPVENEFSIEAEGYTELNYEIYNISGSKVKEDSVNTGSSIDVSGLTAGVYVLKCADVAGNNLGEEKLIIE